MSVGLDGSTQYLAVLSAPSYDADYTLLGWVYLNAGGPLVGTAAFIVSLTQLVDGANDSLLWDYGSDRLALNSGGGGGGGLVEGTMPFLQAAWYPIAMRRASGTVESYTGASAQALALDASVAGGVGRIASSVIVFGAAVDLTLPLPGRLQSWKVYDRALSLAEMQNALAIIRPTALGNIWAWWSLLHAGDYADLSGHGRDFGAGGASTAESPPLSWGAVIPSVPTPPPKLVLSGTAAAAIGEADVRTGGKTVILTLTRATWAPPA